MDTMKIWNISGWVALNGTIDEAKELARFCGLDSLTAADGEAWVFINGAWERSCAMSHNVRVAEKLASALQI